MITNPSPSWIRQQDSILQRMPVFQQAQLYGNTQQPPSLDILHVESGAKESLVNSTPQKRCHRVLYMDLIFIWRNMYVILNYYYKRRAMCIEM